MFKVARSLMLIFNLFLFLIIAGCVSERVTEPDLSTQINLETAIGSMEAMEDIESVHPAYQVYYLKGVDVTINGTAGEWIIGAKEGNETFFYVINTRGGSRVVWSGELSDEQIFIDHILYPEDFFELHPLLMQDLTDGGTRRIDTLELIGDTYYLSVKTDDVLREFHFNAYNGKEIE